MADASSNTEQRHTHTQPMLFEYLPHVKPSALLIGALYTHASSMIVYGPLFGQVWQNAMKYDKNSEYWEREAKSAVAFYGTSITSSFLQSYGVAALINATGTLTYKGAAYLGGFLLLVNSAPSAVHSIFVEKRPLEYVLINALSQSLSIVGLSMVLVKWGTL